MIKKTFATLLLAFAVFLTAFPYIVEAAGPPCGIDFAHSCSGNEVVRYHVAVSGVDRYFGYYCDTNQWRFEVNDSVILNYDQAAVDAAYAWSNGNLPTNGGVAPSASLSWPCGWSTDYSSSCGGGGGGGGAPIFATSTDLYGDYYGVTTGLLPSLLIETVFLAICVGVGLNFLRGLN